MFSIQKKTVRGAKKKGINCIWPKAHLSICELDVTKIGLKYDSIDAFGLHQYKDWLSQITVDGKELCEYKYRMPVVAVTHVDVNGELTLNAVGWEGNYYVRWKFA